MYSTMWFFLNSSWCRLCVRIENSLIDMMATQVHFIRQDNDRMQTHIQSQKVIYLKMHIQYMKWALTLIMSNQ